MESIYKLDSKQESIVYNGKKELKIFKLQKKSTVQKNLFVFLNINNDFFFLSKKNYFSEWKFPNLIMIMSQNIQIMNEIHCLIVLQ